MEPGESLRLEYTVGVPDLMAIVERNADASLPKVSATRFALSAILGSLVAVFALLAMGANAWPVALAIGAGAALGMSLLLPGHVRRKVLARMARRLAEPANAPMLGPRTLAIDTAGMTLTSPTAELRYRWAALQKLVVTPGRLLLYVSGMQAHAIPLGSAEAAAVVASLRERAPWLAIEDDGVR